MSIGKRIKEARESKGLTQRELANRVGITAGAIGNYENGTSSPKETIMFALLDVLNVDANYLFQDDMTENMKKRAFGERLSFQWGAPLLDAYASAEKVRQETICDILKIDYVNPRGEDDSADIAPTAEPLYTTYVAAFGGDGVQEHSKLTMKQIKESQKIAEEIQRRNRR